MFLITLYSVILIAGMIVSQVFDLAAWREIITTVTILCLGYIMIEVGLEFTIHKNKLPQYGWDFVVASTAALFPWALWAIYFIVFFGLEWRESALIGRSAAPTSAGVLFTMLSAAGLGATWLFRKARVLAIFDDLDTILWMIPLQIALVGLKMELLAVVVSIVIFLGAAYIWLNSLRWPVGKLWLFGYSIVLVTVIMIIEHTTNVHLEVLLPAFAFGCILFNPHHAVSDEHPAHEETHLEPEKGWPLLFDRILKGLFMFLVGCSLPKIEMGEMSTGMITLHVLALTVIANLGKCFALFCYRKEANLKTRLALCVAMFPRGEVGAGVLLVAIGYGLGGVALSLSVLSLALNLILTGVFVSIVVRLLKSQDGSVKT